jgi:copper chaperone
MMKRTYNVPDVSCNHCKRAIETALGALDAVNDVDVHVEEKTVVIDFDETRLPETAVLAALAEEGYPVVG